MSGTETALAWARARARGVLRLPPGTATPAGMARLIGLGPETVWAVPEVDDGAGPRVVTELGLAAPALDKPTVAAQVLACVLRCCWTGPHDPLWPGAAATIDEVTSVFGQINRGKSSEYLPRAVRPALRQLGWTGWVQHTASNPRVRLGPRVTQWSDIDLNGLRDLWRMMPEPVKEATQR